MSRKPARRLVGAVLSALDRALADPGDRAPRLRTGTVVLGRAPERTALRIEALVRESLAAPRFVPLGQEAPPRDRVRPVNRFVEERWTAVPVALDGASVAEVAAAASNGVPIAGYRGTQHVRERKRGWATLNADEQREHLASIRQGIPDDAYNGYYPTLRGNDVMHLGDQTFRTATGEVARGGREIRGGRAEYERTMKAQNLYHWDPSCQVATDKIRAEKKQERDAAFALREEKAHRALPRKIGEIAWLLVLIGAGSGWPR